MNVVAKDTGSALFADISIPNTVRMVAETLFARIISEEYPLDSRLPAERNLSAELGVARNTVREALDLLEGRNIISRRAGSGSFVTFQADRDAEPGAGADEHSDLIAAVTSPLQLQVMRGILEPEMVRLAMINMAPRDIEQLGEVLSKMDAIRTDAVAFARLEQEFFMTLAEGTGNPLVETCYRMINAVRRKNSRSAQQKRQFSPKRIEDSQRRFNSLFNAIALRDIENAVEFTKLNLIDDQRMFMQED